ncbi:hypothetical protein ACFSKW_04835 [Nonomuraea mangrovi]|uniref:Uncharacterized protein n=1 Tax=Nonomuraea mangrovi TaxID=2316207 RepID=A0ABW4SNX1_9ACTN
MDDFRAWWQLALLTPAIVSAILAFLSCLTPGGDFLLLGMAMLGWILAAIGWATSPVSSIRRSEGVTEFASEGAGFLIRCGLAHSPGGPAKISDVTSVDHLTGDWYVTCTDFD